MRVRACGGKNLALFEIMGQLGYPRNDVYSLPYSLRSSLFDNSILTQRLYGKIPGIQIVRTPQAPREGTPWEKLMILSRNTGGELFQLAESGQFRGQTFSVRGCGESVVEAIYNLLHKISGTKLVEGKDPVSGRGGEIFQIPGLDTLA